MAVISVLMECYASHFGSLLPTFRYNIWVLSHEYGIDTMSLNVGNKLPTYTAWHPKEWRLHVRKTGISLPKAFHFVKDFSAILADRSFNIPLTWTIPWAAGWRQPTSSSQ